MTVPDDTLKEVQHNLHEVMSKEIRILREMLSTMHEEQRALVEGRADALREIIAKREKLLESVNGEREKRVAIIKELHNLLRPEGEPDEKPETKEVLDLLSEYANSESFEILSLRDEMLALLEKMGAQTDRNNHLIEGKIEHTKQLIERLHPKNPNTTYRQDGTVDQRKKKTKVTIINKEG